MSEVGPFVVVDCSVVAVLLAPVFLVVDFLLKSVLPEPVFLAGGIGGFAWGGLPP